MITIIIITEILNQLFFYIWYSTEWKLVLQKTTGCVKIWWESFSRERLAMGNKSVERRVGWETTRWLMRGASDSQQLHCYAHCTLHNGSAVEGAEELSHSYWLESNTRTRLWQHLPSCEKAQKPSLGCQEPKIQLDSQNNINYILKNNQYMAVKSERKL